MSQSFINSSLDHRKALPFQRKLREGYAITMGTWYGHGLITQDRVTQDFICSSHIHSWSLPLLPTNMTCGRSYINLQHYLSLQMANTRWWGSLQIQAPSSGTLFCSHSHFSPARYTNVSHCKDYPPTLFYLHILQNLISASIFTGYCLSDFREVLRTLN